MIMIKNTQRTISINTKKLQNTIHNILKFLNYNDFDIGIWITTNKTIQKYNKKYRNKDKPTDILSFPFHQIIPGTRIKPKTDEEKQLGDIIISAEFAKNKARVENIPFEKYLIILVIHGICHLLGYTHNTDAAYKKMHQKELQILAHLRLKT